MLVKEKSWGFFLSANKHSADSEELESHVASTIPKSLKINKNSKGKTKDDSDLDTEPE